MKYVLGVFLAFQVRCIRGDSSIKLAKQKWNQLFWFHQFATFVLFPFSITYEILSENLQYYIYHRSSLQRPTRKRLKPTDSISQFTAHLAATLGGYSLPRLTFTHSWKTPRITSAYVEVYFLLLNAMSLYTPVTVAATVVWSNKICGRNTGYYGRLFTSKRDEKKFT